MSGLGGIVLSWVTSPLLAGMLSVGLHQLTDYGIVRSRAPARNALLALPLLFGATAFFTVFMVLAKSQIIRAAGIAVGASAGIAGAVCVSVAAGVWLLLVPYVREKMKYPHLLGIHTVRWSYYFCIYIVIIMHKTGPFTNSGVSKFVKLRVGAMMPYVDAWNEPLPGSRSRTSSNIYMGIIRLSGKIVHA